MGFIVLTAIQLCLCVCTVTADGEFCPAGFEKVEGIKHKCFYYYVDSTGDIDTRVNFSDALEICRGKNATVFEPKSQEEGDTINHFVKEKRNSGNGDVWLNYRDIQDQVSFVGVTDSVLLTSSYMGSLSTFMPLPIEWWSDKWNKGGKRDKGEHCVVWSDNSAVDDLTCNNRCAVVCETDASHDLKQFLKFANENVAV